MATAPRPATHPPETRIEPGRPAEDSLPDWYDRSSLVGDFMVMIEGQSEEDYIRHAPESRFCEFIDRTVYMASPVSLGHQLDLQFLMGLLELFTGERQAGIVLTGPAAIKLRPGCFLEPDIFVLPQGAEHQFHDIDCDPPALLIIEILSKSTRSHDLNRKAGLYREAGVVEVWFVDDRDKALIVHRRTDEGYEIERIETGTYRSRAIPGFWIDVGWLWMSPRPNLLRCFESILAGPPA